MGKERRAAYARADGGANYGGTPYERPSARGRRENHAEGEGFALKGPGEIQASSSSLQALANQERDDRAEKPSLWKSIVTTPYKAFKVSRHAWRVVPLECIHRSCAWPLRSA